MGAPRPCDAPAPARHATPRFAVMWARMQLGCQEKVRPVVVLDRTATGHLLVLAMTSQDRSTWAGFTRFSAATAVTFDKKAKPGWINCREVYELNPDDLRFRGRMGLLGAQESLTVVSALSEWVLDHFDPCVYRTGDETGR